MGMINKPGTYIATPASWAVKADEGKCPRFAIVFSVNQLRIGTEWEPIVNDEKITGFFTLFNKDQSPNEINLRSLRDSLGWDGTSISSLQNGDWSGTQVQIVVEEEMYEGKPRLAVKYLNPKDYAGSGGLDKADPQRVQSLDQKYGAALRTLFKDSKPKTQIEVNPSDQMKQRAWRSFFDKTPGYQDEQRKSAFKRVVQEVVAGKDPKTMTPDDWSAVMTAIESEFDVQTGALLPAV